MEYHCNIFKKQGSTIKLASFIKKLTSTVNKRKYSFETKNILFIWTFEFSAKSFKISINKRRLLISFYFSLGLIQIGEKLWLIFRLEIIFVNLTRHAIYDRLKNRSQHIF